MMKHTHSTLVHNIFIPTSIRTLLSIVNLIIPNDDISKELRSCNKNFSEFSTKKKFVMFCENWKNILMIFIVWMELYQCTLIQKKKSWQKKFNDDARGLFTVAAIKSESLLVEKEKTWWISHHVNVRGEKALRMNGMEKGFARHTWDSFCLFISLQLKATIYSAHLLSLENNSRRST